MPRVHDTPGIGRRPDFFGEDLDKYKLTLFPWDDSIDGWVVSIQGWWECRCDFCATLPRNQRHWIHCWNFVFQGTQYECHLMLAILDGEPDYWQEEKP